MGPHVIAVPYANILAVTVELTENRIQISYRSSRLDKGVVTIEMQSPELADALFGKLWRRLGSSFQLVTVS